MGPETLNAVNLTDVTAGYGRKPILRNITLNIKPNAIVGLVGANGAGKSTLLHTIFGKITPTGGRIEVFGTDLTTRTASDRVEAGMAYVAQGARVFPTLTVEDCLRLAKLRSRGSGFEEVLEIFPRLKDRLTQRAGSLSGGERQMLAVGMALTQQPRILLLDEPSIGLSPKLVKDMMRTVSELHERLGLTVVIAEQNVSVILPLVSEIHVLRVGVIAESVRPEEVRTDADIRRMLL